MEASADRAGRRFKRVATSRPAVRSNAAPAAATSHAGRASNFVPAPLTYVSMHIKKSPRIAQLRTAGGGLGGVESSVVVQLLLVITNRKLCRDRCAAGVFPFIFRREPKTTPLEQS